MLKSLVTTTNHHRASALLGAGAGEPLVGVLRGGEEVEGGRDGVAVVKVADPQVAASKLPLRVRTFLQARSGHVTARMTGYNRKVMDVVKYHKSINGRLSTVV